MTKRIIRRFSEEKIRSDHCVFCGNNLSTVHSHETHKVTRRRIELACNETIEGLPDIYSCSVACKKNISDRRVNTEKHKKCVSKDVDKKLKSWVTDMCQSNVSTEACVHAIHDFSSGRRIEAGAAVVKKITYHPELGHALFKLQYPVDNTMITVGPSGFTSLQAQAPHKRHCSKRLEVLAKPGIWKGLSWAPRHTEYTYIDVEHEKCRELQKGDDTISLPFEAHDSSSRNCMPNSGERVLKRVSELQASFEGQSVLRHQSDKRLRQSKEEIFSLKQTNLKATEAAEKARFNLVRSHSALTSTEQKLDDTQATLKKTKRDGHRQILNARRQSEDKLLSLERDNRKANHAVERANYNAVITHVALNKSTQQLNSTQAELKKANKDAQKMIRTVACLGEAESKLDTETAKVQSQEKQIQVLRAKNVKSIVSKLVDDTKSQPILKIGSLDALIGSPTSMDPKSRRHFDWKRIFTACLDGLLDIFTKKDPDRETTLLFSVDEWAKKKLKNIPGVKLRLEEGDRLQEDLIKNWQNCKKLNDYSGARQSLSLLVNPNRGHGFTPTQLQEKLVLRVDIELHSPVLVLPSGAKKGNNWKCGIVETINTDGSFDVRPMNDAEHNSRSRKNLMCLQSNVQQDRIMHEETIRASDDEIKQASKHAQCLGAGAAVIPITRVGWTRTPVDSNETVALCLRSPSFVSRADGGGATARTGRKWRIKLALISTKEYSRLTAENCCCAICRDLGYVSYASLREVVELVIPLTPRSKKLLKEIDEEELFRSTEFASHLSEESSTPAHCLCHLLAPFNNTNFRQDCVHGRADGKQPPAPISMESQAYPGKARSSDWLSECFLCSSYQKQNLQCCEYCPRVAHKKCIVKSGAEFSTEPKAAWTCEHCIHKHDNLSHDSRCLRCEAHAFLIVDIRNAVKYERALALSRNLATENHDWCIAMVEIADQDLQGYHHHIARNTNQGMVQPYCWDVMSTSQYSDLSDYWARQKEQRHMTATCEGQANKGVSVHGRMFTFRNPSQAIRDKFPEINWSLYPDCPENGGPWFCREYYRTISNSSTQSAEDTARTKFEEEKNFREQHPWLRENMGSMSDGASNYLSTSPLVFDFVSPFVTAKCTSESGEGKDAVDADNGRAQGELQREKDSEGGDLCDASRYQDTLDRKRPAGAINSQIEKTGSGRSMTDEEKKDTKAIPEVKTYHCYTCNGRLVVYEFFSRRLSLKAGRLIGYGRGHVISKNELMNKHQLEAHQASLNSSRMHIKWSDTSSIPAGQDARQNPVGQLSRNQKKQAKKESACKAEKKVVDKERVKQESEDYRASLQTSLLHSCTECHAKFRRRGNLENHKLRDCGLFAKRKHRRSVHDARTVKSLVEAHDDDVGLQAVIREEKGLDLIDFDLPLGHQPGWTLCAERHASSGEILVPLKYENFTWSTPRTRADLPAGSTVRVSATHFIFDGPGDFGLGWEKAYYYGNVDSTTTRLVASLKYEPVEGCLRDSCEIGLHTCDFKNLEVGCPAGTEDETNWPAAISDLESSGAAAQALLYEGCRLVSVNGVATPTLSSVLLQLRQNEPRNRATKFVLRRPPPEPPNRGCARMTQNKGNTRKWDSDVSELFDKIIEDPAFARRGQAVYRELKNTYKTQLSQSGVPKMPSLKAVEARMLLVWKKKKKARLQEELDKTGQLLNEDEDNGDSDDGDVNKSDEVEDCEALKQKHYNDLSGVSVTALRNRIRELMQDPAVSSNDLPAGTPSSGQARSSAVRDHLRNKLAGILAGLGSP